MASDGPDPLVKILDVASGAEISSFSGHLQTDRIWGVAFSPDGKRVATGSWGGGLKIWDANTGQELLDLVGHTSTVTGVDFSPDGKYLATSSTDGTARIWDASSGERLQLYTSPSGAFFDVAFSSDGKTVIASGQGSIYGYGFDLDGTIRLAESRLTRWFTLEECRQFLQQEDCPPR
jgi:WD40 repeat protein